VFVADTTASRIDETLVMLRELPRALAEVAPPPVGVILQANKRDRPDAVPMPELREGVRRAGGHVGIVESVASDGTGIRETFVFSVRLALDRVREQLRTHTVPIGRPTIENGDALLSRMKNDERDAPLELAAPLAAPALLQVLAENDERCEPEADRLTELAPWREEADGLLADSSAPRPPDASAPSGAIWPPVEGRLILHEATSSGMQTHRLRNGSWAAGIGDGWRAYSTADAEYADLDAGREMLVRWARLHASCASVLSANRCIVLATTGRGTWRLWQIVCTEHSLRHHLDDIEQCTTDEAAARLVDVAGILSDMSARLSTAPCPLPCSLDTIGRNERGAVYIGLMPMDRHSAPSIGDVELLGSELQSIFYNALCERRVEVLAAIARAPRLDHSGGAFLAQILQGIAAE
jgi:hypothetical protein